MRQILKRMALSAITCFLFPGPSSAAILRVCSSCTYTSIQDAIDDSTDGDIVWVDPGTYYESIIINKNIDLLGSGPDVTKIIGSGQATISLEAGQVTTGSIRNFSIEGSDYGITTALGLTQPVPSTIPSLQPFITNNVIVDNNYFGLGFNANDSPSIYNNTILQNGIFGIAWSSGSNPYTITSQVENNIVIRQQTGIHLESGNSGGMTVDYNDFWRNGVVLPDGTFLESNYSGINPGSHNINADPQFVDASNGNYHLNSFSTAINAGDPSDAFKDVNGTRNDLGAFGGPYAKILPPESTPPLNLQQPNLGESSLIQIGSNTLDTDNPTVIITHGIDSNATDPSDWVQNMGKAIASDYPNVNVFGYDWSNTAETNWAEKAFLAYLTSSTKPLAVLGIAESEGRKLAAELEFEGYTNTVHMIGHSAGGTLIWSASEVLEKDAHEVAQLTFLDAPSWFTHDTSAVDWADQYVSGAFGRVGTWDHAYRYDLTPPSTIILSNGQSVVGWVLSEPDIASPYYVILNKATGVSSTFPKNDVKTITPPSLTASHAYAHEFYTDTIVDGGSTVGFFWSPTVGGARPSRDSSGQQEFPEVAKPGEEPQLVLKTVVQDTFESLGSWKRSRDVSFINGTAVLTEHSPAYLFEDLTIPLDASILDFDFFFADKGDGDYFTAHFNTDLLFWIRGEDFWGSDFWNSGPLDISRYAGQYGTLTFALNSFGDPNSQVWVDNLRFSSMSETQPIPEPSSLLLVGIGLVGTLRFKKRDRKGKAA
jgi:hypothetical protein